MKKQELIKLIEELNPKSVRPYLFTQSGDVVLRCSVCGQWKQFSYFSQNRGGQSAIFKFRPDCKVCQAHRHAEWLADNPQKVKLYADRQRQKYSGQKR